MALQFVPTALSDHQALVNFMATVFGGGGETNSFTPPVWTWKYFSPHPSWSGCRSYVLKDEHHAIVAHAGIWPIRGVLGGKAFNVIHLIDWAARRTSPGAGIQILRQVADMADIMITVGGSADTRAILPKIGYQPGGVLKRYVRVVRPWLQLRTRLRRDSKDLLRFFRNALRRPLPAVRVRWRVEKVTCYADSVRPALNEPHTESLYPLRTPAGLNRTLECPGADFTGFVLENAEAIPGYFVLSKIGRQARIVDFGVDRALELSDGWKIICNIAARAAYQDDSVAELIVGTSSDEIGNALEQIGFRLRRKDTILYYDPRKLLPRGCTFDLKLADTDLSFFFEAEQPYIS